MKPFNESVGLRGHLCIIATLKRGLTSKKSL